jgi:single-strand DNA-binding protein
MSVNKAILVGSVGKDPEIRSTQSGVEIASFSLATSESWKDKQSGEKKEKTEWHNISVFGGLVNIVKNYVKKGSKLYIEGKIQTEKYTDKNGTEKYATKIVLQGFNSTLQLLNKVEGGVDQHNTDKGNGYQPQDDSDDEIPF